MNVNGVSGWALCRVNNDATTSNYAVHFMSAAPHAGSNYVEHIYDVGNYGGYFFAQHIAGNTNQSNYYSPTLFEIYDYSNTNKFKVMRNLTGFLSNAGSETSIRSVSGLYRSTSAINRLDFISQGGNYMTNSTFALYGIKAAS